MSVSGFSPLDKSAVRSAFMRAALRYDETKRLYEDLEAGRVALSFNNIISMLPRCRSGALRALGVSSAERAPIAPDIRTIAYGVPESRRAHARPIHHR